MFWMCAAALRQESEKVCALASGHDSEESAISSARGPQQTLGIHRAFHSEQEMRL